ncbi:MAG: DUF4331 domain-containing protein [Candidatus Latescibacteria bacterium]|nr:DUF4331 domain-containing protein [Candidatus Latescibacterota bacterium]
MTATMRRASRYTARWNAEDPKREKQFLDFFLNPRLVTVINLAFGTPFATSGRTDLVAALLKYPGQDPNVCNRANRCSELLRLNTTVAPTLPANQKRLGGLAGDAAGFPKIINLLTDPKEREPMNQVYFHTWTLAHFGRLMKEFAISVKREPLIPSGAPLDFVPTTAAK